MFFDTDESESCKLGQRLQTFGNAAQAGQPDAPNFPTERFAHGFSCRDSCTALAEVSAPPSHVAKCAKNDSILFIRVLTPESAVPSIAVSCSRPLFVQAPVGLFAAVHAPHHTCVSLVQTRWRISIVPISKQSLQGFLQMFRGISTKI